MCTFLSTKCHLEIAFSTLAAIVYTAVSEYTCENVRL